MGRSKAWLPFGPETMLQRVVRLLDDLVEQTCVVAAEGQDLPPLPAGVVVARDMRSARGPLEGIAAGMRASDKSTEAVFVCGCDAPLLVPALVERMFGLLGQSDVAVPRDGEFYHPLAAVYRTDVLSHVESLLREDRLRLVDLFQRVRTREIATDDLRDVDPELATLKNLNQPEDYQAALRRAGLV